MKQGNRVELKMKKMLCTPESIDEKKHLCKVLRYDVKEECIYLMLGNDLLTDISLDALYECEVEGSEGKMHCSGVVKDRYYNEFGKIIKFEIKNGFYKINVKSVDK